MNRSRKQAIAARQRRRTQWISVAVVAALLLAGLVGLAIYQSQRSGDVQPPAQATADGSGLADGAGPVRVEIWLDLHCPHCRTFEEQASGALDQLVADGQITRIYHPVSFLDRFSTTGYSTRAAAAVGCAADGGAHVPYVQALLAAQPPAGGPGLDAGQMIDIGAAEGLTGAEFADCVRSVEYRGWVQQVTDAAAEAGVTGTPTVRVNGATVEPSVPAITAAVQAAGS